MFYHTSHPLMQYHTLCFKALKTQKEPPHKRTAFEKNGLYFFALFLLLPAALLAQLNDDPCSATSLSVNANCIYTTQSTFGATSSAGVPVPPCSNYGGADVWFAVTVPASGNLIIDTDTGGVSDGAMAVYSGVACNSLNVIACDSNSSMNGAGGVGGGVMPRITLTGQTPGSTVWIRFWPETGGGSGTFNICVNDNNPPPCSASPAAGDICQNATYMCTLGGYCASTSAAYSFTNALGADENTYLSWISSGPFCGTIENNSWLSFTAISPSITLNVWSYSCTSNFGIQMQIYQTPDCFSFTPVSNCWFPGTPTSGIITATALVPGQLYYLMIDGAQGDACNYVIQPGDGVFVGIDAGPSQTITCGQSVQLNATGAPNIYWLPHASLSSTAVPNPTASPTITTTYYAYAGIQACTSNQATDSVVVYVTGSPGSAIDAGPSQTISCGQLVQLNATGAPNIYWLPHASLSSTAIPNPTASPTITVIYYAYATVQVCNSSVLVKDSVTVYVTGAVNNFIDAGPLQTIPCGQSVQLNATGAPNIYWQPNASLSHTAVPNPTASPTITTTYYAYAVIPACSSYLASDSVVIVVTGPLIPPLDAGPNTTIYCGQKAQLNATGAPVIYWLPHASLSSTAVANPIASPSVTTTYYAYMLHPCNGSLVKDSVTVAVNFSLSLQVKTVPSSCFTALGQASVTVGNGSQPYSYLWSPGGETGASLSALAPGPYSVIVKDAGNCSGKAFALIETDHSLQASLGADRIKCDEFVPLVLDLQPACNCSYTWSTGQTSPTIAVNSAGTYSVLVKSAYCSVGDLIHISNPPRPEISRRGDFCEDMKVTLSVKEGLFDSYTWSTGETTHTISIAAGGPYHVMVSLGNCLLADTILVSTSEGFSALYVPNTITPNADRLNDVFKPVGEGVTGYHLQIFSRWGQKIFETGTFEEGWDGTYKGKLVEDGIYVWLMDYTLNCTKKKQIQKTGHVVIMK